LILTNIIKKIGRLEADAAKLIINKAMEIFKNEPNVLELETPINCKSINDSDLEII